MGFFKKLKEGIKVYKKYRKINKFIKKFKRKMKNIFGENFIKIEKFGIGTVKMKKFILPSVDLVLSVKDYSLLNQVIDKIKETGGKVIKSDKVSTMIKYDVSDLDIKAFIFHIYVHDSEIHEGIKKEITDKMSKGELVEYNVLAKNFKVNKKADLDKIIDSFKKTAKIIVDKINK